MLSTNLLMLRLSRGVVTPRAWAPPFSSSSSSLPQTPRFCLATEHPPSTFASLPYLQPHSNSIIFNAVLNSYLCNLLAYHRFQGTIPDATRRDSQSSADLCKPPLSADTLSKVAYVEPIATNHHEATPLTRVVCSRTLRATRLQ
jgi:hypothetical protein